MTRPHHRDPRSLSPLVSRASPTLRDRDQIHVLRKHVQIPFDQMVPLVISVTVSRGPTYPHSAPGSLSSGFKGWFTHTWLGDTSGHLTTYNPLYPSDEDDSPTPCDCVW